MLLLRITLRVCRPSLAPKYDSRVRKSRVSMSTPRHFPSSPIHFQDASRTDAACGATKFEINQAHTEKAWSKLADRCSQAHTRVHVGTTFRQMRAHRVSQNRPHSSTWAFYPSPERTNSGVSLVCSAFPVPSMAVPPPSVNTKCTSIAIN